MTRNAFSEGLYLDLTAHNTHAFYQPTKCWYCVNYGRRDTEKGLAFEPNQYKRLRGQKWMEKKISIPMWFRMKISRIKRPECTCNESADRSV